MFFLNFELFYSWNQSKSEKLSLDFVFIPDPGYNTWGSFSVLVYVLFVASKLGLGYELPMEFL